MKLLTTSSVLTATLRTLMQKYARYRWSVAWASTGFALYDALLKHRDRIAQLVIGTHFYQTHPDVLEALHSHSKVRFVLQPSDLFHPKLYLFENDKDHWACVIGSSNFTGAAFSSNVEAAVLIDSRSPQAREVYRSLSTALERHWGLATTITDDQIKGYRFLWKRNRNRARKLSGAFGGKPLADVPLFGLSWSDFANRVKTSEGSKVLAKRLAILDAIATFFRPGHSFSQLGDDDRRKVAGYASEKEMQWRYFGSMVGAGHFKHAVNSNDPNIAAALDGVPLDGLVTRDHYDAYISTFCKAFPKGGHGIAVATRLLCMKRPDMFLCFDSKNKQKLCKEFGIAQANMDYNRYWDEIVERVREAEWWNSSPPTDPDERSIWSARTALLDSLYYEPKV